MPESTLWMVFYTALALGAVVAIFLMSWRLVNAARAGNMRFKWGNRSNKPS
jgi:hypothetical protein